MFFSKQSNVQFIYILQQNSPLNRVFNPPTTRKPNFSCSVVAFLTEHICISGTSVNLWESTFVIKLIQLKQISFTSIKPQRTVLTIILQRLVLTICLCMHAVQRVPSPLPGQSSSKQFGRIQFVCHQIIARRIHHDASRFLTWNSMFRVS